MADFTAIADVSRSLRRLLQDRMQPGSSVTIAPPDQTVDGFDGPRVNLYPLQVIENTSLKNEQAPLSGHPGSRGRPPLWLNIRYMLTSHAGGENQPDSDLTAQEILGDAMRILHVFGNRMREVTAINIAPPADQEPILVPELLGEFERIKVSLHQATLEDVTKVWSALSEENLRRSVFYEVTVVMIAHTDPPPVPLPVEERRVFASLAQGPGIERVFVTPPAGQPEVEMRVAVGEEITIVTEHVLADRVFVQFGDLRPMRVPLPSGGRIRVAVPDGVLDVDFDPLTQVPIADADLLQPGSLEIRLIVEHDTEGVAGALGPGTRIEDARRYVSNTCILQLVPQVTGVAPVQGPSGTVLQVTGTRLWHAAAQEAQVVIGNASLAIRAPDVAGAWAEPTPTVVEVPVIDTGLSPLAAADPPYVVAVHVDGARSRATALGFRLVP